MENSINQLNTSSQRSDYIQYEYLTKKVKNDDKSLYLDSYENFGWTPIEETINYSSIGSINLKFKRDRKIENKTELLKLQRELEIKIKEVETKKSTINNNPMIGALIVGFVGTVAMAGAVFSYLASIWAAFIPLSIIGILCWGSAYFVHKKLLKVTKTKIEPTIENIYDEIGAICKEAKAYLI